MNALQGQLTHSCFVLRTDVKGFYESIDHSLLLQSLDNDLQSKYVRRLLYHYLNRTVEWGGLYRDIQQGISRGSALSPVLGAYYLKSLDDQMADQGIFYRRYMDDIIVLAPTRWKAYLNVLCTPPQIGDQFCKTTRYLLVICTGIWYFCRPF